MKEKYNIMKWNKTNRLDDINDFELRKEKRKQRFKNKKKDRKRFNGKDKLFDDRCDDDDEQFDGNDNE